MTCLPGSPFPCPLWFPSSPHPRHVAVQVHSCPNPERTGAHGSKGYGAPEPRAALRARVPGAPDTHTHTGLHTAHRHVQLTHTRAHAHTHVCTRSCSHTCTHNLHTSSGTLTHAHTQIHPRARMHTHTGAYSCTHAHSLIPTLITHTHLHTNTLTCVCTLQGRSPLCCRPADQGVTPPHGHLEAPRES